MRTHSDRSDRNANALLGQGRGLERERVNEASTFSEARRPGPRSPARTYSRDAWLEAQLAWDDGTFSDEWKPWRHKAAMELGVIYPPAGTAYDSWEDDNPSQRAILIRAIRETPALLAKCFRGSRSWSDVIAKLTRSRDEWRAELRAAALDEEPDDVPSSREATVALKRILDRIGES
jgi:hypothetical protein